MELGFGFILLFQFKFLVFLLIYLLQQFNFYNTKQKKILSNRGNFLIT